MLDALGRVVPDSILTILALRGVNASSGVVVISENTSTAVAEEAERLGPSGSLEAEWGRHSPC